jgi:uncharacterized membrane protein YhaH (DUF805 family)
MKQNTNITAPPVMTGGARDLFMDMVKRHESPLTIYTLLALILCIVYVKQIPIKIRRLADTLFGRLALFVLTIAVGKYTTFSNGLLLALLSLLLLSMSPRTNEGYQDARSVKKVTDKNLWWVEQVFKENPTEIDEDEVKTSAIQDGSTNGRSTGSSNGP